MFARTYEKSVCCRAQEGSRVVVFVFLATSLYRKYAQAHQRYTLSALLYDREIITYSTLRSPHLELLRNGLHTSHAQYTARGLY